MDRRRSREKTAKASPTEPSSQISASGACIIQLLCGLGLAAAFFLSENVYSVDLVTDPSHTLFLIWITELPILILLYSHYRQNREQCTYLRAVGRGLLAMPVGALVSYLGAVALGAPVTIQYLKKNIHWSFMMSLFTTVPASCVFGSSFADWRRIFVHTKPNGTLDYLICLPAHGAIIGAWFGAWPMPLDWERPWQEWPICVSYGAITGYLVAVVASCGVAIAHRSKHVKGE
ncbi:hypothetical protein L6164_011497 [Bauhinia variegata]|uniref:Uncharacterized protein n=1 Tax=Bauhinia variegata TaxID=167791 RepID=A0ACB9P6W4_BAUVA|nr:hypothetical protein L6164_011497 [Bauhinia variegata]